VSAEYRGPLPDPNANNRRSSSELWGQWGPNDEDDTQPYQAISPSTQEKDTSQPPQAFEEFSHREHVTGGLPAYPADAPLFRPTYMPYPPPQGQGQQGYIPAQQPFPGQAYSPPQPVQQQWHPPYQAAYPPYAGSPAYPGYNGYYQPYPYAWQPPRPKRDGFHLAVCIITLVGSILAVLGGLACIVLLFLVFLNTSRVGVVIQRSQLFSGIMTFLAFIIAGVGGGGFGIYHSIRGIMRKPSAQFALPWFWVFLIPYLFILGIGYVLRANGQEVAHTSLTAFLIVLAAIFPALTIAAIGNRQLRFPQWPTTWRRFATALINGATFSIGLALLLELGFLVLLVRGQATNFQQCIGDPTLPGCGSYATFNLIFLVVAIIGPVVEETVKPLAVAFFIRRMHSAAEAFVLGMGAGLGFAMVETVGYIGSGYHSWLEVAIERSGAGLLHGFGAAMVALGWYYLTRAETHRFRKAFACWTYAVFQHFIWNGTAVLALIPGPVGDTLNNWNLKLGAITIPFVEVLNILESILILIFFIYMLKRVRRQKPPSPSAEEGKPEQAANRTWQPQGVGMR